MNPNINDYGIIFHHVGGDEALFPDRRDQDISLQGQGAEIAR
jgi:hypothetical protein